MAKNRARVSKKLHIEERMSAHQRRVEKFKTAFNCKVCGKPVDLDSDTMTDVRLSVQMARLAGYELEGISHIECRQ